jgi:lysophospholipase L1-like esterase
MSFVATGDSKSFGFASELATNISYAFPHGGITAIDKSHPGYILAQLQAATAADIATVVALQKPIPYVLLTIGNGDLWDPMPDHATWVSNYQAVVDAWQAAFPAVQIYCCREWSHDPAANEPTLKGWLDEVIASRSAFVHAGPREADLIVPPDNGATYYADGIHPNAAGYHLLALDWQSRMGL